LALLWLATGCGGIQASKTITPLDFILPGLLQTEPPPAPTSDPSVPEAEPVQQLAQN
jgi:hypothetical protein